MDKPKDRIPLKAFWEIFELRLAGYSADGLRAILLAMAQQTPPTGRQAFLDQLKPLPEIVVRVTETAPQEDLLADIDDWMDEVCSAMEHAEDYEERHGCGWGEDYDDEDSLGPYAEFVEPLTALFDLAAAAFDYGNLTLARAAYQKLLGEALYLEG